MVKKRNGEYETREISWTEDASTDRNLERNDGNIRFNEQGRPPPLMRQTVSLWLTLSWLLRWTSSTSYAFGPSVGAAEQ